MAAKNNQPARRMRIPRISNVAKVLTLYGILLLSALLYTATVFKNKEFGNTQIEELLFLFFNGFAGGNTADIQEMIYGNLVLFGVVLFLFLLPVVDFYRNKIRLRINLSLFGKNKILSFNPSRIPWWVKFVYTLVVFSGVLWFTMVSFQIPSYLRGISASSQLFDEHYVDPEKVTLAFPEQKQNLIYIISESMENTITSRSAGGQRDASVIPELEKLALDPKNISFSHNRTGLGGAQPVLGTTWTAASMTAQMLGVPIKPNLTGVGDNDLGDLNKFFPGAYGIGQVLRDAGYNQSFVMGSDQTFGGRDKLLAQHGKYHVIDLKEAIASKRLPKDYKVWWGYEDKKLFAFAKDEATRLAAENKPFNLSMLTADTHFVDGYLDASCPTPYAAQYDNVYACSSAMIVDFVRWVQEQPFAKNTTIVIVGDHPGMQQSYYDGIIDNPSYKRTTYNAIVNAKHQSAETTSRQFAAFDMYPTTLSALGVKIPGNRLGLGTDLFAKDTPTLLEQYGSLDDLNSELSKRSHYYDQKIMTGVK